MSCWLASVHSLILSSPAHLCPHCRSFPIDEPGHLSPGATSFKCTCAARARSYGPFRVPRRLRSCHEHPHGSGERLHIGMAEKGLLSEGHSNQTHVVSPHTFGLQSLRVSTLSCNSCLSNPVPFMHWDSPSLVCLALSELDEHGDTCSHRKYNKLPSSGPAPQPPTLFTPPRTRQRRPPPGLPVPPGQSWMPSVFRQRTDDLNLTWTQAAISPDLRTQGAWHMPTAAHMSRNSWGIYRNELTRKIRCRD